MCCRLFAFVIVLCCAVPLGAQTHFPAPSSPGGNRFTQPKALLGMALFWEEQLSSSNSVACGTCHRFPAGGADPRLGLHPGLDGVFGTPDDVRGSPGGSVRTRAGTESRAFTVIAGASRSRCCVTSPFAGRTSIRTLSTPSPTSWTYDRGGDFHVNQAVEIQPLNLTAQEKSDLIAFLQALTDPRVASGVPPFDAPDLGGVTLSAPTLGMGMVGSTGQLVRSVPDGPVLLGQGYELAAQGVAPGQPAFVLWDGGVRANDYFMFGLRLRLSLSPALYLTFAGSLSVSPLAQFVGFFTVTCSSAISPRISP